MCAAPSFSFVCTQSHRELTHNPCFVWIAQAFHLTSKTQREAWVAQNPGPLAAASAVVLNSSYNRDKTALVAAVHNSRSLFAC